MTEEGAVVVPAARGAAWRLAAWTSMFLVAGAAVAVQAEPRFAGLWLLLAMLGASRAWIAPPPWRGEMRFDREGVRMRAEGFERTLAWARVRQIIDRGDVLEVELEDGARLRLSARVIADRGAVLDLVPGWVRKHRRGAAIERVIVRRVPREVVEGVAIALLLATAGLMLAR